ncbi:hypothetical protein NHX12_020394 [Muraenolepis orangiensis]|uniref:Uncharacterized protein n=1 Tax=Muraenolepis orangiensis TaxID=630683 RepID=A0A9Q0ISY9_9TELE|nr:hypothetical protein NHX12_020394 [Muraenolepis orangiensis]
MGPPAQMFMRRLCGGRVAMVMAHSPSDASGAVQTPSDTPLSDGGAPASRSQPFDSALDGGKRGRDGAGKGEEVEAIPKRPHPFRTDYAPVCAPPSRRPAVSRKALGRSMQPGSSTVRFANLTVLCPGPVTDVTAGSEGTVRPNRNSLFPIRGRTYEKNPCVRARLRVSPVE